MAIFFNRLFRAVKLDRNLYEEVEADRSSMGQALFIVILSSVAAAIGNMQQDIRLISSSTASALMTWWAWALIVYLIGTKVFPEPQTRSNIGELLRTIGFSCAPGLLRIFGLIPGFAYIIYPISSAWMILSMVVAVRQALDYDGILRAIGVCVTSWFCLFVFSGVLIYINHLILQPFAK